MHFLSGRFISSGILGVLFPVLLICHQQSKQEGIKVDQIEGASSDRLPAQDTLDYIMGRFEPSVHEWFKPVDQLYANRTGMYLRKETLDAFIKMYDAALKSGVQLKIISATRNFNSQKSIWEDKWTGKRLVEDGQNLALTTPDPVKRALKILEYSSMPGSSRHHWGTDMDLNALDNNFFQQGEGKRIYDWLTAHAAEYGFCQPYTAGRPHGYKEERWHWSYMPIARPLTTFSSKSLNNNMITGFLGAETAVNIDVVSHYILGINQECR